MDEQTVAELTMLRARAYGPDADLARDPEALRRLGELEDLALTAAATASTVDRRVPPEPPRPALVVTERVEPAGEPAAADDPASDEPADARGTRLWWTRRRVGLLWAASIATAVALAATAAAAFTYRVQADPREVAVLALDPTAEVPAIFGEGSSETELYDEFFGLLPVAVDWGNPSFGSLCLTVVVADTVDDGSNSFSGPASGCGAGAFSATASFVVTSDLPAELRERFPEGTALQFVLEDSRVVVLSLPPEPTREPSAEAVR